MIGFSPAGRCDSDVFVSDSVSDIAATYVLTITVSWRESSITLSLLSGGLAHFPTQSVYCPCRRYDVQQTLDMKAKRSWPGFFPAIDLIQSCNTSASKLLTRDMPFFDNVDFAGKELIYYFKERA